MSRFFFFLLVACVLVTVSSCNSLEKNEVCTQQVVRIVSETELVSAIVTHNAEASLIAANKLREYELKANAVDEVYNSLDVYKHAALFAAAQGNSAVFNQVIEIVPEYSEMNQILMATRGTEKQSPAPIPHLVEIKFGEWNKLTPAQQPIWGSYIMSFYPRLDRSAAQSIANKVNSARVFMSASKLADVAIELSKFEGKDVPVAFQAENVFNNAVDMALFLHDKAGLEKIIALYDNAPFKKASVAKELQAELKAMGGTRAAGRLSFGEDAIDGRSIRKYSGLLESYDGKEW